MKGVRTRLLVGLCACAVALGLSACAGGAADVSGEYTALDAYPTADMSTYDCAEGYTGAYRFVDMTVADIAAEMDAGTTFVLYAGYNHCPWCNSVLNYLNDIATERGIKIAYLDTRKDPSWQSNTDVADYDLFVERFGDALPLDDDGKKHLYVPHLFFVKDGKVVSDHPGTVPSQESSSDALTEAQIQEYRTTIAGHLDGIGLTAPQTQEQA